LSVIISTMDGIERASVIVDIPSDGTSPRKPTASVTVKTTEGATLNGQHFLAIQNLVSSAFPKLRIGGIFTNLQPRDVTVTDVSKAYTWSDEAASPSERRLNEAKRACEATLEERCRKACAHVPGIELAFGVTATERPMVEGMELGKNDMYARFTLDDKEHVVCLRITGVEASLGVPESYAGQVWNERNPVEQGKEPSTPKKADLAKIAEEEMILVEEAIVSLIPEGITRLDVSARIVPESPDLDASTTDYAWFETDLEPQEGRIIVALNGRNHVLLSTKPEDMMLADDKGERQWALDDISVGKDHGGRPSIKFKFDKAGAKRFGELTGSHLPNGEHAYPLAILIDGKVVSMPNIQSKITSQGVITGEFNSSEVRDMVEALRRGMKPQGKNTLE